MFAVNGDMFGRYVKIPHVLANDGGKFIFKVVGMLQSNAYYSVPIGGINSEYKIRGAEMVDVLHVIQCGVDETEVLTVALKDCEFVEPRTNAEKIKGMSVEELAETIYELDFDNGLCPLYDMYEKRKSESGGCSYDCKKCLFEWLESECDAEC